MISRQISRDKIHLIKAFERRKSEERKRLGWNMKQQLVKSDDRIHTDAVREMLNAVFIHALMDKKSKRLRAKL